jgi:hypothetical protein
MNECLQIQEGAVKCLLHPFEAKSNCLLVFCLDCGKDLYRECEVA